MRIRTARTAAALTVLTAMLLVLTGCVPVDQTLRRLGLNPQKVVTVGAQVPLAGGTATVYHFIEGARCGEGFSYANARAEGSEDCLSMGPLTRAGSTGPDLAVWFGRINDLAISEVRVTLTDGQERKAAIGDGVWYVLLPGKEQGPVPAIQAMQALDDDGRVIYSFP